MTRTPRTACRRTSARRQRIAFGADSGAYTVQTNGGGGYRVDAAAAKFSKTVAAALLRDRPGAIYGYVYGGSGGSYQTIGAIENTIGVWDGAVPFIVGRADVDPEQLLRAGLRPVRAGRPRPPQIADAVAPGGVATPSPGSTTSSGRCWLEVTRMGVPLRAWEDYRYVLGLDAPDGLLGFGGTVRAIDPTYVNDFWTKPGYVGTEQSPLGDLFRAARTGDVNNDWNLALLTYHRHQVPKRPGFYAFDQFRGAGRTAALPAAAARDRTADLRQRHRRGHPHRQHPRQGDRGRQPARHRRLPLACRLVRRPGAGGARGSASRTTSGSGTTTTPTTSVPARPVSSSTTASSSRRCGT